MPIRLQEETVLYTATIRIRWERDVVYENIHTWTGFIAQLRYHPETLTQRVLYAPIWEILYCRNPTFYYKYVELKTHRVIQHRERAMPDSP